MFSGHKLQGAGGVGGEAYWITLLGEASQYNRAYSAHETGSSAVSIFGARSGSSSIRHSVGVLNADGSLNWGKQNSTAYSVGEDGVVDSAGNLLFVGRYSLSAEGNLVKLTNTGTVSWQVTASIQFNSVDVDSSDNVYVSSVAGANLVTIKYNSSGTQQWVRSMTPTNAPNDTAIRVTPSDDVIVAFSAYSAFGYMTVYITKYNSSGTVQWQRQYSTGSDVYLSPRNSIDVDSSGNIYISCARSLGVILKINSSGTLQWQKYYGHNIQGLRLSADGNSLYTAGYGGSPVSGYIMELDTSGSVVWANLLSDGVSSNTAYLVGASVAESGALLVCGETDIDGAGTSDQIIMRLPPDGTGTGTYGNLDYSSTSVSATTLSWTFGSGGFTSSSSSTTAGTSQTYSTWSPTEETFTI